MTTRARETSGDESLDGPVASDPALRSSGVQTRAQRAVSGQMPVSAQDPLPLVSIGAPADPALLEPTYAYLSAYCFACLPAQVAQRLNVAIYELYANALRYGTEAGEVRLEIRRGAGGRGATLSVKNHARPSELERVQAQIARVQDDPSAAFSREMNRFAGAAQPPPMLGIVRVAHEASLQLELQILGDRVEISAICPA